jgi:hypothetical protein
MLLRMKMAGELVSPARGLYTTANHPCLLHFTNDTPPVPNVSPRDAQRDVSKQTVK